MARGARKSTLEKLHEELSEVRESIDQYQESLTTLKQREKVLLEQVDMEEFKTITVMLNEQGMTLEDLKVLVKGSSSDQQSA